MDFVPNAFGEEEHPVKDVAFRRNNDQKCNNKAKNTQYVQNGGVDLVRGFPFVSEGFLLSGKL